MQWFYNLKIRTKLASVLSVVFILFLFLSYYTATQFNFLNRINHNMSSSVVQRQTNLADLLSTLTLLRLNNISTSMKYYNDDISQVLYGLRRLDYQVQIDKFNSIIDDYISNLKLDIRLSNTYEQERTSLILEVKDLFNEQFYYVFLKISEGVDTQSSDKVIEGLTLGFNVGSEMTNILNELRDKETLYFDSEYKEVAQYNTRVITLLFVTTGFVILISIIVSISMSRSIVVPILKLGHSAKHIADGELNYPIRMSYPNEIGELSNDIGDMVDALKLATQAKSDFLANMSHEMRTPLNVIMGVSDLMIEDSNLKEGISDDVYKIRKAGEVLLGIVNDILDLSKIDTGNFSLNIDEYDTAKLIQEVVSLHLSRLKDDRIVFHLFIEPDVPAYLYGDALRVKQIFNNLLSNAFKYTQQGSITLIISATYNEEMIRNHQMNLCITVKDTGIGIKPEDVERLFHDYFQVDTKANRKHDGTGLGLPITKKLIEAMEGQIEVESSYGEGTTFVVHILQTFQNVVAIDSTRREQLTQLNLSLVPQEKTQSIQRPNLEHCKVLAADDFQTNLDVIKRLLSKYKIQVDCVLSGQEAVDLIQKHEIEYDAILMDHMMPGMDGLEATKQIRGLNTAYAKTIPIIALTANAIKGSEQMFLDSGFQAFLSKPINLQNLDEIITRCIIDS